MPTENAFTSDQLDIVELLMTFQRQITEHREEMATFSENLGRRVTALESENGVLRRKLYEHENVFKALGIVIAAVKKP